MESSVQQWAFFATYLIYQEQEKYPTNWPHVLDAWMIQHDDTFYQCVVLHTYPRADP